MNLYGYVLNDPVQLLDPSGRHPAAAGWLAAAVEAGPLAAAFGVGFAVGDAIAPFVMDRFIDSLGNEWYAKGGKKNVRDSGLAGLSDEHVQVLYDAASGVAKKKFEKELKVRKKRNKSKRGIGPGQDDDACK